MSTASLTELPDWAQVTPKRREHIERVTMLLNTWAAAMRLPPDQVRLWLDAGRLHDAVRDMPVPALRELTGDHRSPEGLLHGPAAAILLERHGETRRELLDAIRYHTVGSTSWAMTGKALYMADFLEPGRKFARIDRHFLATLVPTAFDAVFGQVVRMRLEWAVREGNYIFPETVALWNSLR